MRWLTSRLAILCCEGSWRLQSVMEAFSKLARAKVQPIMLLWSRRAP